MSFYLTSDKSFLNFFYVNITNYHRIRIEVDLTPFEKTRTCQPYTLIFLLYNNLFDPRRTELNQIRVQLTRSRRQYFVIVRPHVGGQTRSQLLKVEKKNFT